MTELASGGVRARPRDWVIAGAASAAFLILAAAYAGLYRLQLPYFDQWDIVGYVIEDRLGALNPLSLFQAHDFHWHTAGYFVMVASARLTGFAHGGEAAASVAAAALTCLLVWRVLAGAAGELGRADAAPWLLVLAAFLVFSLDQAQNWQWGFQISVFLNTAGAAGMILALSRPTLLRTLAGAAGAAVAVYSFGTGLALLPLGGALIAARASSWRQAAAALALWTIVSAALLAHYVWGVVINGVRSPETLAHDDVVGAILRGLLTAANYLGAPTARMDAVLAPTFGVLGVAATIWAARGLAGRSWARWRALAPVLALALFAIGSAMLTAIGRADLDPSQGRVARYISWGNFLWMAALGLGVLALQERVGRKPVRIAVAVFFGLAVFAKVLSSGQRAAANAEIAREVAAVRTEIVSRWPDVDDATLHRVSTPQQNIRPKLEQLHALGLDPFRRSGTEQAETPEADPAGASRSLSEP